MHRKLQPGIGILDEILDEFKNLLRDSDFPRLSRTISRSPVSIRRATQCTREASEAAAEPASNLGEVAEDPREGPRGGARRRRRGRRSGAGGRRRRLVVGRGAEGREEAGDVEEVASELREVVPDAAEASHRHG